MFQTGAKRDPMLPDVPLMTELAKTEEQRQILRLISSPTLLGQPYTAPPGIPAERLAVLRQAFAATMRDKDFAADTKKANYIINPISADELSHFVRETVTASADIAAKARAIVGTETN